MTEHGDTDHPSESDREHERKLIEAAEQEATEMAAMGSFTPPPDSFAGYNILREIHRGGQGVVYQAIQKSTKRKVAIKVMKEGPFAGSTDRARFDREVEILGQLNHPNIVAIHDSGTAAGHFFFVMDYISGQPLDVWMASSERSIDETLKLFAKICQAVNAAHLQGVIHRDLKPGNIRIDGEGKPYILDFGLAKVAVGHVSNGSRPQAMTITGQFMGSLPWASPEQAEAIPGKVDIRTDVYALGVILYQMLTGKFPYEVVGNMRDVLDNILKAEPAKPSTIRKQINDEVETIVLKCLSKERERRYQSAGELGRDIGHYMAGDPIEAKRDSALYVLRKQFRRYRFRVAVGAAFVLIGAAGLATSLTFWRQAAWERDVATAARVEALRARVKADAQRKLANEQTEALRWQDYVNTIALAQNAYEASDIAQMGQLLERCPESLRGWEWHRLTWLSRRCRQTLDGHDDCVSSVAFSPDGKAIASASWDGTLKLWDPATNMELKVLNGQGSYDVAFNHDGTYIASGEWNNGVTVWDTRSGTLLRTFKGHSNRVKAVDFSPDGSRILSASLDGKLKLWFSNDDQEPLTINAHDSEISAAAFIGPDGHLIVSAGGEDRTLKIWDANSGKEIITLRGHDGEVNTLAVNVNGSRIVSGSSDRTLKLWDAESGLELETLKGHDAEVLAVAFNPDGSRIVSGSQDRTLKIWDAESGLELETLKGHGATVAAVAFSPDSRRIVSGGVDRALRIWDVDTGGETRMVNVSPWLSRLMAISPDGRRIASGDFFNQVTLWDTETGRQLRTLGIGESLAREHKAMISGERSFRPVNYVRAIAFSPDDDRILSGSSNALRMWYPESNKRPHTLKGHFGEVTAVAFSSDGSHFISAGPMCMILWDAQTGEQLRTFVGHLGAVSVVAFSPNDGKRVLSGHWNNTLKLWDVETGKHLRTFEGHDSQLIFDVGEVYPITFTFSPDGSKIVSGSSDRTVRVWDVESGEERKVLKGHSGGIIAVAYHPDGSRFVSTSDDKTVRVWDAETYDELLVLRKLKEPVVKFAFIRDSLFMVFRNGSMAIWRVHDLAPQELTSRRLARQAWAEVDKLFARLYLRADVIDALKADKSLNEDLRRKAITIAKARSSDPVRCNDACWTIVRQPEDRLEQYQYALRLAEEAKWLAPRAGAFLNTLGVAQYRVGQYHKALRTLKRSHRLNKRPLSDRLLGLNSHTPREGLPADLAFLAMSHFQLGHTDEANAKLYRLEKLMKDPCHAEDEESHAFYHEAELLILGIEPPGSNVEEHDAELTTQPVSDDQD